jgi:hypothetical protein
MVMKQKYILLTMILFVFFFLFFATSLALIPGDFGSANNGPPDGVVDFEDLMIFAMAYGSTPSDANWNVLCDIAGQGSTTPDGVIDFEDLMIFAMHYGERERATWTVMVYLDGDNNLEYNAWDDLSEMESIGSSNEINIVTQLDLYYSYSGTYRYYVTGVAQGVSYPLYTDDIVQTLPEQNMADPATLTAFVNWATLNYPAEKYLLVIWNHGAGWREYNIPTKGVVWDDTSGDYLTMAELVQGLNGINEKIDIIGFDACLMQMIEVAYEISGLANVPNYMVASQESEWGDGWPYDDILAHLTSTPAMDEATLCETIVNDFINYCGSVGTLSTFDFSTFNSNTIQVINSFATALMASSYQNEIATARSSAQSYSYSSGYRCKDLFDFAERIYNNVLDCQDEALAVMNQINNLVLFEAHIGSQVANSHGLSIYLTDNSGEYVNDYNDLQFAIDTQWDEFLKQEQITPGHMAVIWYDWPQPSGNGFSNFDVLLTIEVDPGIQSAYYWAHSFYFKNEEIGYMGLQTNGYMQGEWVGKMAIFSMWDALVAEPGPGASCEEFTGEGEGWSCRIKYSWVEGRIYDLRVGALGVDAQENEWWGAWIIDTSSNQETYIGKIKVPGSWQWLDNSSAVWVEYYGQVNDCDSTPYAKASFEQPIADNGSFIPQNLTSIIGTTCTNAQITLIENQGVIFETGGSL